MPVPQRSSIPIDAEQHTAPSASAAAADAVQTSSSAPTLSQPKSVPLMMASTGCFPTSSRLTPITAPSVSPETCSASGSTQHNLRLFSSQDFETLAVPLAMAHLLWYPTCEHTPSLNTQHGTKRHGHNNDHRQDTSSCCSHARDHHLEILQEAQKHLKLVGTAFRSCSREMVQFALWDPHTWCLQVPPHFETSIAEKLNEFGYYSDANGRIQDTFNPKCPTPYACQSTHSVTSPSTKAATCCTNPAAALIATPTVGIVPNDTQPTSSRGKQKQPEPALHPSPHADCRKPSRLGVFDAARNVHMTPSATLAEVIRSLNLAVLRLGVVSGDNLIYAEFASMVALLNYAAAFYCDLATKMESYMQNHLDSNLMRDISVAMYETRTVYIQAEEKRTSSSSKRCMERGQEQQDKRKQEVRNAQCSTSVSGTMDLRDGVQTVLFTFVWITCTAFQGIEETMASMLHILIPLLQTVIVRCMRQTYHMHRALAAKAAFAEISVQRRPFSHELQWYLVDLSAALQNFAGQDVVLFTSGVYDASKGNKSSSGAKKRLSWKEGMVSCSYTAHIYTVAIADITFRALMRLIEACDSGVFKEPEPEPEKESEAERSKACRCKTTRETAMNKVDTVSKRLTLIERWQPNWKSQLVSPRDAKQATKRASELGQGAATGTSHGPAGVQVAGAIELNEILLKRLKQVRGDGVAAYANASIQNQTHVAPTGYEAPNKIKPAKISVKPISNLQNLCSTSIQLAAASQPPCKRVEKELVAPKLFGCPLPPLTLTCNDSAPQATLTRILTNPTTPFYTCHRIPLTIPTQSASRCVYPEFQSFITTLLGERYADEIASNSNSNSNPTIACQETSLLDDKIFCQFIWNMMEQSPGLAAGPVLKQFTNSLRRSDLRCGRGDADNHNE